MVYENISGVFNIRGVVGGFNTGERRLVHPGGFLHDLCVYQDTLVPKVYGTSGPAGMFVPKPLAMIYGRSVKHFISAASLGPQALNPI